MPNDYFQGLTSNPADTSVYFTGLFQGLWKTTPRLSRVAGVPVAIPPAVVAAEGYNHIGDPTWAKGEGGRVILPLECYSPRLGNTCGTGAFGVADPATLAFRYYVKLDPAEIPKAMWAETSPDGKLIWTSSGNDLLAYRTSDVTAANAAPAHAPIRAARRLRDAVPPSGITGAVFVRGRLLLAGEGEQLPDLVREHEDRRAPARVRHRDVRRGRGPRHDLHARRASCTGCCRRSTTASSPTRRAARSCTSSARPGRPRLTVKVARPALLAFPGALACSCG